MVKLVLDAMGGDFAPQEVIRGAKLAIDAYDVFIVFSGKKTVIQPVIDDLNIPNDRYEILDAPDVIEMNDSASGSYRSKKKSSIRVGLDYVKDGQADGFVSAGNTGAVMMASLMVFGRIDGVDRPALATLMPSQKEPFVMTDLGSNVDCKPENLLQFAIMGSFFAKIRLNVSEPKVGLLNIGEEEEKGNALTLATYPLLKASFLNFVGNIEAKHIYKGNVDVVVCDAFVGNTLLKVSEGIADVFFDFFSSEYRRSWLSRLALLLFKLPLSSFRRKYDYNQYGGALLLGVKGVSVVAHGSSSSVAIQTAIHAGIESVTGNIVSRIEEAMMS